MYCSPVYRGPTSNSCPLTISVDIFGTSVRSTGVTKNTRRCRCVHCNRAAVSQRSLHSHTDSLARERRRRRTCFPQSAGFSEAGRDEPSGEPPLRRRTFSFRSYAASYGSSLLRHLCEAAPPRGEDERGGLCCEARSFLTASDSTPVWRHYYFIRHFRSHTAPVDHTKHHRAKCFSAYRRYLIIVY